MGIRFCGVISLCNFQKIGESVAVDIPVSIRGIVRIHPVLQFDLVADAVADLHNIDYPTQCSHRGVPPKDMVEGKL